MHDKDEIIAKLRANQTELKAAGLKHLYLFGSVARGDHDEGSDIDLVGEFTVESTANWRTPLIAASTVESALGHHGFDFVEAQRLNSYAAESFQNDKVLVF